MNHQDYFKNKKITVMGLGVLGRGVGDALFLAECGAQLIVTDLKKEKDLTQSIEKLSGFKNVKFVLGRHRIEDFQKRDMILKSAGVPLDSVYIKEAIKNKIPIEMSASLFLRLSGLTAVGVTGTRGKSTVAHLIYHIVKDSGEDCLLGGNVYGVANLPFLKTAKKNTLAVLELDSWQLQGFGYSKISPHIAVFTNFFRDHLNYYNNDLGAYFKDKTNIFAYQGPEDFLICGEDVARKIQQECSEKIKGSMRIVSDSKSLKECKLKIPGEHNRKNVAYAVAVAELLGIERDIIRRSIESFPGVPGRLEYVKSIDGVKIYNDTNSTTQEATVAALRALGSDGKNIVLIMGGADKSLGSEKLVEVLPRYARAVILLPGSGTDKIRDEIFRIKTLESLEVKTLEEAVKKAFSLSGSGDTILFSPGFASFGLFRNEYDRGEQFIKILDRLK